MKISRHSTYQFLFIGLLCFLCMACNRLPKELIAEAEKQKEALQTMPQEIKTAATAYEKQTQSPEFAAYKVYAQREKWALAFKEAETELSRANQQYTNVEEFIHRNSNNEKAALIRSMGTVTNTLKKVRTLYQRPQNRIDTADRAKKNATQLEKQAQASLKSIRSSFSTLLPLKTKAEQDFSFRKPEIEKRYQQVKALESQSLKAYEVVKTQFQAHQKKQKPDYLYLYDNEFLLSSMTSKMPQAVNNYKTQLTELNQSYTKILVDSRMDYYAVVARSSWNNYSDYDYETTYKYGARMIPQNTFDYLMKWNPNSNIANGRNGHPAIANNHWQKLEINGNEGWPSGDTDAVFWIEDLLTPTYHKYLIIKNGKEQEAQWKEVDEDFYFETLDDLGMELESKPYGYFVDESIKTPQPVGMSMVGNQRYGQWRGSGAQRYWQWHPNYIFIGGYIDAGHRYYYDDWDDWRLHYRGKKAYYGLNPKHRCYRGKNQPCYGSGGYYTSRNAYYINSRFAKSGGFQSSSSRFRTGASVRGAGQFTRGRGPGGGGK